MNQKEQNDLVIVCVSDTHSQQDKLQMPKGDILIHAGDFSSTGTGAEIESFAIWLKKQQFKHKIVIAGNHDVTLDIETYKSSNEKIHHHYLKTPEDPVKIKDRLKECCTYLENQSVTFEGYKFWGSPYSLEYYRWAFQVKAGEPSERMWEMIPTNTDVVITHGPPYKVLDKVDHDECSDINVGCPILFQHITERIKPKYHIFGHIHESYGQVTHGETTFVNASSCTLKYRPTNPPIVITLPRR